MQNMLGIAFAALAVIFTVWNLTALKSFLQFRRVAPTAELTWAPQRPWFYNMCLGIGFFMVSLTAVSVFILDRPLVTIVSQALMALYYTVLFPLSFRIRRGFYANGIWSERRFVPYADVRWLGWKEKPEVVLALRMDGGPMRPGYGFLRVPGELFGQARRILAGHIEDHSLSIEQGVLGLAESETQAQEQV